MISLTNGQVPIVAGIFSPFNNNTAEQMLQQIQAAKQNGGSGFAIFDTAHLTGRMARALNASSRPQPRTRMVMDTSNHGPIPNN
jgi:hypothetical protein